MWDIFNISVWKQFFLNGGPVVTVLFCLGIVLWFLLIERFTFMMLEYPQSSKKMIHNWCTRKDLISWNAHKIRECMLSENKQSLERGLSTIKVLIAVCPLLGLLGTVTGMLGVFEIISITGNSNAKAMGSGIYKATLPTMVGLFLALTAIYFNHTLQVRIKHKRIQLADALTIYSHKKLDTKTGDTI